MPAYIWFKLYSVLEVCFERIKVGIPKSIDE